MKAQAPIRVRYVLPYWLIGLGLTVVLVVMLAAGEMPRLLTALLWPGLRLAELMGYGVHDLHQSFLVVVINSIFCGAIVFVIMLLTRKR